VSMLIKEPKIPRIELNTVNLYQHYSLFMHNELRYTSRGDYCKCVRPAQVPVLTEVRAPSLLEQHPRYVPHRDRAGYNSIVLSVKSEAPRLSKYSFHEIICDELEKLLPPLSRCECTVNIDAAASPSLFWYLLTKLYRVTSKDTLMSVGFSLWFPHY
jgi:hypothetical protein